MKVRRLAIHDGRNTRKSTVDDAEKTGCVHCVDRGDCEQCYSFSVCLSHVVCAKCRSDGTRVECKSDGRHAKITLCVDQSCNIRLVYLAHSPCSVQTTHVCISRDACCTNIHSHAHCVFCMSDGECGKFQTRRTTKNPKTILGNRITYNGE
jgi:hypothetical protein